MSTEPNEPSHEATLPPALNGAAFARIGSYFFLSRLLILAVAALSQRVLFPGSFAGLGGTWMERFALWDTSWYLDIARNGYFYSAATESSVAFYPLYPLLIRAVSWLGADSLLAGYIISHLALACACLFLWKLAALETRSAETAELAVIFLLFCPAAVWFGMVYTESLFLLTVLGCILAARQGRWLTAGAWGFAAALTRTPGLLLAGFLFLEAGQQWWERRRLAGSTEKDLEPAATASRLSFWRPAAAVAGPLLGHAAFLAYLQIVFGDWRAQQKTMLMWNAGGLRAPWIAFTMQWKEGLSFFPAIGFPLLITVVALGLLSIFTLRRWGYPALVLLLAVLYLSSTSGHSLPRYLSTAAPIYLVMAQLAGRSRALEIALLVFSVGLLALLTVLLVNGYHII